MNNCTRIALTLAGPALAAVVLCIPRIGLGYFWDDYIFLTSSHANPLAFLVPGPTTFFYRPISMGLYFLSLGALGPAGGLIGHILNLALLVLCILLLRALVTRIAGPRAGLIAGISYATLSSVPSLVAWITTSQDLFAIAFLLIAFHLRHSGRALAALAATACALLSKESAVALLPVLVLWPWVVQKRPHRLLPDAALYCGLAALWVVIHPGVRALFAHGLSNPAIGYVHAQQPETWGPKAGRYVLYVFNLPWTGYPTPWPGDLTLYGAAALALVLVSLWLGPRRTSRAPSTTGHLSVRRAIILAALLTLPPIALDTVLVGHWAPYYTALPGLGAAVLIGMLLARASTSVLAPALSLHLILGVWCRGVSEPRELAFTERNFVAASSAIHWVEKSLLQLQPSAPSGAQFLVSVGQVGTLGITQTMLQGQAARIWYHDPTLETMFPVQRRVSDRPEYLFRITSDFNVLEIDPDSTRFRSSVGRAPPADEIGRTIRSYARGLAATREEDRAVRILLRLAKVDKDTFRDYDLRLAAMIRLAQGRIAEAESLKALSGQIPRDIAVNWTGKIFAEPTVDPRSDTKAFWAFDISESDTSVVRHLMRMYRDSGYPDQACAFARRMGRLAPGDVESAVILRGCPDGATVR